MMLPLFCFYFLLLHGVQTDLNTTKVCEIEQCRHVDKSGQLIHLTNGTVLIPVGDNCSISLKNVTSYNAAIQLNFNRSSTQLVFNPNTESLFEVKTDETQVTGTYLTGIKLFWSGNTFGIVYRDDTSSEYLDFHGDINIGYRAEVLRSEWSIHLSTGCSYLAICSCDTPKLGPPKQTGDNVTAMITSLDPVKDPDEESVIEGQSSRVWYIIGSCISVILVIGILLVALYHRATTPTTSHLNPDEEDPLLLVVLYHRAIRKLRRVTRPPPRPPPVESIPTTSHHYEEESIPTNPHPNPDDEDPVYADLVVRSSPRQKPDGVYDQLDRTAHTNLATELCDLDECSKVNPPGLRTGSLTNGTVLIPEGGWCNIEFINSKNSIQSLQLKLNKRLAQLVYANPKPSHFQGSPMTRHLTNVTGSIIIGIRMFWSGNTFGIVYREDTKAEMLQIPEDTDREWFIGRWSETFSEKCSNLSICTCDTPRVAPLEQTGNNVTAVITSLDPVKVSWFADGTEIQNGTVEPGYQQNTTITVDRNTTKQVMITATNTVTGKETTQLIDITTEKEPDEESVIEDQSSPVKWYIIGSFILAHTNLATELCDLEECSKVNPSGQLLRSLTNGTVLIPVGGWCTITLKNITNSFQSLQFNLNKRLVQLVHANLKPRLFQGSPMTRHLTNVTGSDIIGIRMFWSGNTFGIVYREDTKAEMLQFPKYVSKADRETFLKSDWSLTVSEECSYLAICSCDTAQLGPLQQTGNKVTAIVTSLDPVIVSWFAYGTEIKNGTVKAGYQQNTTINVDLKTTKQVMITATNTVTGKETTQVIILEDPVEEHPPGQNIEVENEYDDTSHFVGFYVFGILSAVLVVVALLFVTNYLVRSRSPPVIPIERVELPPLDSYEEPIYERLTFTNGGNTQEHVGYVHMERRKSGEPVMDSQGI
eukprot:sb/3461788/